MRFGFSGNMRVNANCIANETRTGLFSCCELLSCGRKRRGLGFRRSIADDHQQKSGTPCERGGRFVASFGTN